MEEAREDELVRVGECWEVGEYEGREEGESIGLCVGDEGENLKELACWPIGEARGFTVGVGLDGRFASGGRVKVELGGMAATLGKLAEEAMRRY